MNFDLIRRIAILAPFHTIALRDAIRELPVDEPGFPRGMGGYNICSLVMERLRRGLPTDVITLCPTAREPIMRWDGGPARLWVVQRRRRGALRDGYRRERYLLQQALRESNPDVCHANWTYEYGLAAVIQRDYPVVLTVHDHAWNCLKWLGPKYLPLYLSTQYVLHHTKHITTVSPYVSEYLEKKLCRKVPVIPNLLPKLVWHLGAKKATIRGHKFETERLWSFKMLSAINWSRLKNAKRALRAFQIARECCMEKGVDLQYTLIGPGLETNGPAEQWARMHHCAEGVFFHGNVPYEEALQMMAASNILMHPSLEESFGAPIAEAMLMGIPVMAAREAGGARWLLDEGHCGLLFSGASLESMASAMISMALHPRTEMTETAYGRIAQICDADEVLAAYERVYRQAASSRTGMPARPVAPTRIKE